MLIVSITAFTQPLVTKPEWCRAKIAPCWPLTGSIYTAIIKAVRDMLIFDLKGGMSGSASRDIHSSWRFIFGHVFCRQKKRTGKHKNTRNAATQLWYCCHAFLGPNHISSVLGTARVQYGFGSISFTLAGEKVPSQAGSVPAHFIKASWASTARLGSARLGMILAHLVMFTLPLLIVPSRTGTVLARFHVAV